MVAREAGSGTAELPATSAVRVARGEATSPVTQSALGVVGVVDQGVVRAIYDTVVVKITVAPAGDGGAGFFLEEGAVDAGVIRAIDFSIQVSVTEVGVFDEDVGRGGGVAIEFIG